MITPQGINYQQGLGSAVILPGADPTPLRQVMQNRHQQQMQNDRIAAEQEMQKRQMLHEILYKERDAAQRRDDKVIAQKEQEFYDFFAKVRDEQGENAFAFGSDALNELYQRRAEIDHLVDRSQQDFTLMRKDLAEIQSGNYEFLDELGAMEIIYDDYYGPDRTKNVLTPSSGSRRSFLEAFDDGAYLDSFVKQLPEVVSPDYDIKSDGFGTLIEERDRISKFFEIDPSTGKVAIDENGDPIIRVTPEVVSQALQHEGFSKSINRQLQKPENYGLSRSELAAEKLNPRAKMSTKSRLRTGHRYPSKTDGNGNKTKGNEDLVLTEVSKLMMHDPNKIKSGTDAQITLWDGTQKSVIKVPSLFDKKETGEDSEGVPVSYEAIYVDPTEEGGFYVEDTDGNVQRINSSNVYDLLSVLSENSGQYEREMFDRVMLKKDAYDNGQFNPSKFFTPSVQEQAKLKLNEIEHRTAVAEREQQKEQAIKDMTKADNWWNSPFGWPVLKTYYTGADDTLLATSANNLTDIFRDIGFEVDGKRISNVQIGYSNSTGFEIRKVRPNNGKPKLDDDLEVVPEYDVIKTNIVPSDMIELVKKNQVDFRQYLK